MRTSKSLFVLSLVVMIASGYYVARASPLTSRIAPLEAVYCHEPVSAVGGDFEAWVPEAPAPDDDESFEVCDGDPLGVQEVWQNRAPSRRDVF